MKDVEIEELVGRYISPPYYYQVMTLSPSSYINIRKNLILSNFIIFFKKILKILNFGMFSVSGQGDDDHPF